MEFPHVVGLMLKMGFKHPDRLELLMRALRKRLSNGGMMVNAAVVATIRDSIGANPAVLQALLTTLEEEYASAIPVVSTAV